MKNRRQFLALSAAAAAMSVSPLDGLVGVAVAAMPK